MTGPKDEENVESYRLSDLVKKVVNTGIGAAFMTEDTIKSLLQEVPDKKEFVNRLLQNAKTSKEEVLKSAKKEIRGYLERFDVGHEVDRILENYNVEIKASVNFKRKPGKKSKEGPSKQSSSKQSSSKKES